MRIRSLERYIINLKSYFTNEYEQKHFWTTVSSQVICKHIKHKNNFQNYTQHSKIMPLYKFSCRFKSRYIFDSYIASIIVLTEFSSLSLQREAKMCLKLVSRSSCFDTSWAF